MSPLCKAWSKPPNQHKIWRCWPLLYDSVNTDWICLQICVYLFDRFLLRSWFTDPLFHDFWKDLKVIALPIFWVVGDIWPDNFPADFITKEIVLLSYSSIHLNQMKLSVAVLYECKISEKENHLICMYEFSKCLSVGKVRRKDKIVLLVNLHRASFIYATWHIWPH